MASKSAEQRKPVTRGTGNVFADLGFPDAAERQAKLRLAYALNQVLEVRKLSQADAATLPISGNAGATCMGTDLATRSNR